jgi:hypothetical protein
MVVALTFIEEVNKRDAGMIGEYSKLGGCAWASRARVGSRN